MPFKEVSDLRKSGHLQEAFSMALAEYESEPSNIWNKRSLAWVYHDFLKSVASPDKIDEFTEYLSKLIELDLPEEEKMIFDNCLFQTGKLLFAASKEPNSSTEAINEILEKIKQFHFTIPGEAYSFLYKAVHKFYKNRPEFLMFADWWDFRNFRPEDFQGELYNGKTLMSIAEQAFINYAKKLLEGEPMIQSGEIITGAINQEKVREFLPLLDQVIEAHPEFQYPLYYKARLLIELEEEELVMKTFLPFAIKKSRDFWVWEILADILPESDSAKLDCLCKALSVNTPETFLVNTRQKLATLLISKGLFNEAKTEIMLLVRTRSENAWKIPGQVRSWMDQQWFAEAKEYENNSELYQVHAPKANNILFNDILEELVIVEYVNKEKKILNFVRDQNKHGFFKYAQFLKDPKIGDQLMVRFSEDQSEGKFTALTVSEVSGHESPAVRSFSGKIKIIESAGIGFADNVFLDPVKIKRHRLVQEQPISGKAILSYDKKKQKWGWKAIELDLNK